MTWSVATPMWVTPPSSSASTDAEDAARRADLPPVGVPGRRHGEEVPEQLVGAVDEVDQHEWDLSNDWGRLRSAVRPGRPPLRSTDGGLRIVTRRHRWMLAQSSWSRTTRCVVYRGPGRRCRLHWCRPGATQSGPVVTVIRDNRTAVPAGESVTADLAVVPAADATGEATAMVGGLGVTGGRLRAALLELRPGCVCRPATGCAPCPAGERCLVHIFAIDVRTPPGPHGVPFTVTDSRGRTTRGAIAIEVLPAADRDADGMPDWWEWDFGLRADSAAGDDGPAADPRTAAMARATWRSSAAGPIPEHGITAISRRPRAAIAEPGFEQCFRVVANQRETFGAAGITLIGDGGRRTRAHRNIERSPARRSARLNRDEHPADRVVAAIVEGDTPFVVERRVSTRRGSNAATVLPFGTAGVRRRRRPAGSSPTAARTVRSTRSISPLQPQGSTPRLPRPPSPTVLPRGRRCCGRRSSSGAGQAYDAVGSMPMSLGLAASRRRRRSPPPVPSSSSARGRRDPPGRTVTQAVSPRLGRAGRRVVVAPHLPLKPTDRRATTRPS